MAEIVVALLAVAVIASVFSFATWQRTVRFHLDYCTSKCFKLISPRAGVIWLCLLADHYIGIEAAIRGMKELIHTKNSLLEVVLF